MNQEVKRHDWFKGPSNQNWVPDLEGNWFTLVTGFCKRCERHITVKKIITREEAYSVRDLSLLCDYQKDKAYKEVEESPCLG